MRYTDTLMFILVLLSAISCCEEKPDGPTTKTHHGIFVSNEGTFNFNNASVGWYDLTQKKYFGQVYRDSNDVKVGDVLQSILLTGDTAWLVINNSNRILLMDAGDFKQIGEVGGLTSPRYALPVGGRYVWVSDYKSDSITVVDLRTLKVDHRFRFAPGWSEQMLEVGTKVWVTHPALYSGAPTHYIYEVDSRSERVTDSIRVPASPVAIVRGRTGEGWVYCQGHTPSGTPGGIARVSFDSKEVLDSVTFASGGTQPLGAGLSYDAKGERVFYLREDVFVIDAASSSSPRRIVPAEGKTFYAMRYIPDLGEVWVSDAIDFVQRGVVERYTSDGVFLSRFTAGVIPNGFYALP